LSKLRYARRHSGYGPGLGFGVVPVEGVDEVEVGVVEGGFVDGDVTGVAVGVVAALEEVDEAEVGVVEGGFVDGDVTGVAVGVVAAGQGKVLHGLASNSSCS